MYEAINKILTRKLQNEQGSYGLTKQSNLTKLFNLDHCSKNYCMKITQQQSPAYTETYITASAMSRGVKIWNIIHTS